MNINFNCSSCSKEPQGSVPIERIIEKLNEHFDRNDLVAVGRLLEYWSAEARALGDTRGLLEILNEQIGYYRRISDKDKGLAAVEEAFALVETLGFNGTVSGGTLYVNGATTMKAFGLATESIQYYEKAKEIYDRLLSENDYKMAAYYNNVSSAYLELGDIESAERSCYAAISILERLGGFRGEIAVTLVNLAHMYYKKDPCDERIYSSIEEAWEHLTAPENVPNGDLAFLISKCYPSFEFFGYFDMAVKLKNYMEKIYAGT